MWKYVGDGAWVPGVPARDLTDEEYEEHKARLPKGSPAAALYEEVKVKSASARKEGEEE